MHFRFSEGARVIQFPSGSMPIISECACCDIWRIKVLRYSSGIHSLGSILIPASMRSWNARSSGDIASRVLSVSTPVFTICAYIAGLRFADLNLWLRLMTLVHHALGFPRERPLDRARLRYVDRRADAHVGLDLVLEFLAQSHSLGRANRGVVRADFDVYLQLVQMTFSGNNEQIRGRQRRDREDQLFQLTGEHIYPPDDQHV